MSPSLSVLCIFWILYTHNFPSTLIGDLHPNGRTIVVNRLRPHVLLISLNGSLHLKCQSSHLRCTLRLTSSSSTQMPPIYLNGPTECTVTLCQITGIQLTFHTPLSPMTGLLNLLLESAVVLLILVPIRYQWTFTGLRVGLYKSMNPQEGTGMLTVCLFDIHIASSDAILI